MWMPINKVDFLEPGKQLRMEIVMELNNILQLDYEIVVRYGDRFKLKLLMTNGKTMSDHPGRYKQVRYHVLYYAGVKMWVAEEAGQKRNENNG